MNWWRRISWIITLALAHSSLLVADGSAPLPAEGDTRGARLIAPPSAGAGVAGNTGGATYSMAIAVLAGRTGFTPHLTLSYSSMDRVAGPWGLGWSLNHSWIERTGRRGGIPNYQGHPDETGLLNETGDQDEIILNLNGSSSRLWRRADGTYHTEQESYLMIHYHRYQGDPQNRRGGYWAVWDQHGNGYIFGFGFNGRSTVTKSLGYQCRYETEVRGPLYSRWYLDRMIDARGNTISFEYLEGNPNPPPACYSFLGEPLISATQAALLSHIKYNGYTSALRDLASPESFISTIQPMPEASARHLRIEYEKRADSQISYRSGYETRSDWRATQILVHAGTARLRKYELQYEPSPEPGQSSRLISVQEFGTDDLAGLPPTRFSYTDSRGDACTEPSCMWEHQGDASFILPTRQPDDPPAYLALTLARNGRNKNYNMGMRLADINGDGCADVLQGWHEMDQTPVRRAWISDCRGNFRLDLRYDPPAIFEDETGRREDRQFVLDHGFRLADLNGDGKNDLLRGFRNEANDGGTWAGCPDGRTCLEAWENRTCADSAGDFCRQWQDCAPPNDLRPACRSLAWQANDALAPPEPFTIFRDRPRRNADRGAQLLDLNGDGLVDLVVSSWSAAGSYKSAWFNTGLAARGDPGRGVWREGEPRHWVPEFLTGELGYSGLDLGTRFVDINGDGLVDLLVAMDYSVQHDSGCAGLFRTGSRSRNVWMNTGDGWQFDGGDGLETRRVSRYVFPRPFSQILGRLRREGGACLSDPDNPLRSLQNGQLLADVNQDGLLDVLMRKDPYIHEVTMNSSQGWVVGSSSYKAPVTIAQDIADWVEESRGMQELDWNADGSADLVQLYRNVRTGVIFQRRWRNKSERPDLLKTITHPLGGVTTLEYSPTTVVPDLPSAANPNPALPFILAVVKTIYTDPGIGALGETRYRFSQGNYYGDAEKQEFRGFGQVRTILVGAGADDPSAETLTTYLQEDWNKGLPEWAGILDPSTAPARIYEMTQPQYACFLPGDPHPAPVDCRQTRPPFRHYLVRQDQFYCHGEITEGDGPLEPCRRTASRLAYDNNGNLREETLYGIIGLDGDVTRFTGDEKTITRTFADRVGFTGLPVQVKVYDGARPDETNLLSQNRFSYDNPHADPDCFRQQPMAPDCLDAPADFLRPLRRGVLTGIHRGGVWRAGETEPDPWQSHHHKTDAYGNIIRVIDPRGQATTGSFSDDRPLIRSYLPTRTNNAAGQESMFRYDDQLRPSETLDPNGCRSQSQYDGLGRLAQHWVCRDTIDRHGPSQRFHYQASSSPGQSYLRSETRDQYENPSEYHWRKEVYDGFGRLLQVQQESDQRGQAIAITTRYHKRGRVAETTLPTELDNVAPDSRYISFSAPSTRAAYNVTGKMLRLTAPDNTIRRIDYRPGEPGDEQTLESLTHTDEEGRSRQLHYDAWGQLIKVEERIDGNIYPTRYAYDKLGRLSRSTNHRGHTSLFFFNSLSQKMKTIDPDMGTWRYSYDASGNMATQTNAKGKTVTFVHDSMNRLVQKNYNCEGLENCAPPIRYEYDQGLHGRGRLARINDHSGTRTFDYDQKGRVIQTSYEICREGDARVYTFSSDQYDPSDRLRRKTYPDGETLNISYNARGLLQALQIRASEGDAWLPVLRDLSYNAVGKPKSIFFGNGTTTDYSYYDTTTPEPNFRLKGIVTATDSGRIQDQTYGYDLAGHIQTLRGTIGAGRGFNISQDFRYDDLYRLTSATWLGDAGGYGRLNFAYDALGNITNKDSQTYEYLDPDHVHAVTTVRGGAFTWLYNYDANGNLTQVRKNGSPQRRLSYNRDDRLTVFRDLENSTVEKYVYDEAGHRGAKIKSPDSAIPEVTLYLDNGGYLIKPDGTIVKYLLTAARRETPLAGSPRTFYIHTDALNSTSLMTDAGQSIVELAVYKPHGEILRNEPRIELPFGERYKFTGHEFDGESRWYYMGARYYDPHLGRFLSPDAIAPNHGDPQDLNRFAYARNNPTTLADPTGEKFSWFNLIVSVAAGALTGGLMTPVGEALQISSQITGAGLVSSIAQVPVYGFSAAGAGLGAGLGGVSSVVTQKSPLAGKILNAAASAFLGGIGQGPFAASGWQGALAAGATSGVDAYNPFLGAAAGFGFARALGLQAAGQGSANGFSFDGGQLQYHWQIGSAGGLNVGLSAGLHLNSLQGSFGLRGAWSLGSRASAEVGIGAAVDPRSGFLGPHLSARLLGSVGVPNNAATGSSSILRLAFGAEYGLKASAHLGHHLNYFGQVGVEGAAHNGGSYSAWVSANVYYSEALRPRDPNQFGGALFNPRRPLRPQQSYRWVGAPVKVNHAP